MGRDASANGELLALLKKAAIANVEADRANRKAVRANVRPLSVWHFPRSNQGVVISLRPLSLRVSGASKLHTSVPF